MNKGIYASGREACARALNRAVYEVVKVAPDCVWIEDCSRDSQLAVKSVTNDAEHVCEELFARYGQRRFLYRDTDGNWDELVHEAGKFTEFKSARGQEPGKWADD